MAWNAFLTVGARSRRDSKAPRNPADNETQIPPNSQIDGFRSDARLYSFDDVNFRAENNRFDREFNSVPISSSKRLVICRVRNLRDFTVFSSNTRNWGATTTPIAIMHSASQSGESPTCVESSFHARRWAAAVNSWLGTRILARPSKSRLPRSWKLILQIHLLTYEMRKTKLELWSGPPQSRS